MKALTMAAQEEEEEDFEDNYTLLGLSARSNPTASEVLPAHFSLFKDLIYVVNVFGR
jgi:hypothetical protein